MIHAIAIALATLQMEMAAEEDAAEDDAAAEESSGDE